MPNKNGDTEATLYEPVKEYLVSSFKTTFGRCYLETTASGTFTEKIKEHVRHDIIFTFMRRKASPDLTGYTWPKVPGFPNGNLLANILRNDDPDFITVEIKKEKITPQDIYQAKMYGDLFQAKYALLISPKPIPEEIKRLDKNLFLTGRFMSGWAVYIGQWTTDGVKNAILNWLPRSPFPN